MVLCFRFLLKTLIELRTKFSAIPKATITWFVYFNLFIDLFLSRYKANGLNTPSISNDNIEISELPDGTNVLKVKKN
jgi:hypothetical protein